MVISVPSRRDRRKRETRTRIISAGIDLFGRRGLDGCTIDDVATAADVGKGTIYNYFRTKDEIVVAFMVDVESQAQQKLESFALGREPAESILTRFIQTQFDLKAPHHQFVRVFLAELCGRATTDSAWVHEIQALMDPPLARVFSAMADRNLLRTDIDVGAAIRAFTVMQLGLMVLWAIEGPPWTSTIAATRTQVRLFCSGVEVKP